MDNFDISGAVDEIVNVEKECIDVITRIIAFCPPVEGQYPQEFRLLATPMLYSIWERCFTLCNSVALRVLRDCANSPTRLAPIQRAVWLQKQPFYQSFFDQLTNSLRAETSEVDVKKRCKKGPFATLTALLESFEQWMESPLDESLEVEKLVMTFSNVNPDVVALNANVIGISNHSSFKEIRFGLLHNLVGRRNELGHGGIIDPPKNEEFKQLLEFTEVLVSAYCHAHSTWIKDSFGAIEMRGFCT